MYLSQWRFSEVVDFSVFCCLKSLAVLHLLLGSLSNYTIRCISIWNPYIISCLKGIFKREKTPNLLILMVRSQALWVLAFLVTLVCLYIFFLPFQMFSATLYRSNTLTLHKIFRVILAKNWLLFLWGGEIFPAVESSSKSAPPVPHSLRLFCFFGKYFTAPFISTGSPCCKAAGWNTFTLIVFYFITLESAALVSVYRTGSLLGTAAGVADGWA